MPSSPTEADSHEEEYPIFGKYGRGGLAHPIYRRALFSVSLVLAILIIGTVLFHYIEHYAWINSFYFVSMLATAEGPPYAPVTALGKIVASIFAFVSIGSVIFALAFIFGPLFGRLLRLGEKEIKKEEKVIKREEKVIGRRLIKYEKRL